MPETPRLRPGNSQPQNLYLLNADGSETIAGVAMTPEFAEMIIRRFNATADTEADIRADERRKVIEEIRNLARWEMQGGYIDLFAFKDRHDRLSHIEATHLSMAFRALADEIEGEAREPR